MSSWLLALSLAAVSGCGGAESTKPAESGGVTAEDEEKAARLLERAREEGSEERLRLVIARFGDTKASESARADLGVMLAKAAEAALAKGELDLADEKALEAKIYGDLQVTRQAQATLDQVDDNRAELVSKEANASAESGKCASALKRVASTLGPKSRERYRTKVQAASRGPIVKCLAEKIEEEVKAGNVDGARSLLTTADVGVALDKQGQVDADKALAKSIVKRSVTSIQPMLEKFEWAPAIAEVDRLRAEKTLDAREYEAAFSLIQEAILARLVQRARDAFTDKAPSKIWEEIEAAEKLALWKNRPEELTDLYGLLRIALECEKAKCKLGRSKAHWSWGKIALKSADNLNGNSDVKLTHAQRVWVVGDAKGWALVSLEDPGDAKGEALLRKVSGWANKDQLKTTDTELWLPPEDQLPGTRVWGPLRAPKKDYHLGIVKEVVGGTNVIVKRLSDEEPVTVKLSELRVGTLKAGLKVMAFCVDQLVPEQAKVDRVVTSAGGIPKVNVICDKEKKERVEVAGALTTQVRWLPPRKP